MQNQGTILVKAQDKAIPDDLLTKLLGTSSCVGVCAVAQDGTTKKNFFQISREAEVSLEAVNALQVHFMENELTFCFQRFEEEFNPDNMQPYSLLDGDDKKPIVLGFLEGNFAGRRLPTSDLCGEWHVAQMIKAKLTKLWNSAEIGKNIDKLMKHISSDEDFKSDMNLYHVGRGSIVMVGLNAELCKFGTNPQEEAHDWGYCSKTESEPEPDIADTPEPEADVPAPTFSLKGKTEPAPKAVAAEPEKEVAAELKKQDKPETKIEAPKTEKVVRKVMARPPAGGNRNSIKKWYRSHGYEELPENYMTRPEVEIELIEEVPLKSFQDLGAKLNNKTDNKKAAPAPSSTKSAVAKLAGVFGLGGEAPKEEPQAPAEKDPKDAPAEKEPDINTKALPSTEQPSNVLQFIPQGQKSDISLKFMTSVAIKKALDQSSNAIIAPSVIQEVEKKYPDFMEQIGLEGGLERTFNWPHESRVLLCKEYPHAAAVWIHSLISLICEYQIKANSAKVEPKQEEEQKPEQPAEVKTGTDDKNAKLAKLFNRM